MELKRSVFFSNLFGNMIKRVSRHLTVNETTFDCVPGFHFDVSCVEKRFEGLFIGTFSVAARLRSLRTNDPLKGHPRPIKQKLEL